MRFPMFPGFSLSGTELSIELPEMMEMLCVLQRPIRQPSGTGGLKLLRCGWYKWGAGFFIYICLNLNSHMWLVATLLDSTAREAWKHTALCLFLSDFLALASLASPLPVSFSLSAPSFLTPSTWHLLASALHPKEHRLPWIWEHVS